LKKNPIKILFNPVSGNGAGKKLLRVASLYTIAPTDPENINEQLLNFLAPEDHLIIAGGDGTFHQVINGLYETQLYKIVTVSFLPLGTGNDLAKSLKIKNRGLDYLIKNAHKKIKFPLWKFNDQIFINYLSLGIDAKCLDDFTRWRTYIPNNRWVNFIFYGVAGIKNMLYRKKIIELKLQENLVIKKKAYSIIFSNIRYYGGGCPLIIEKNSKIPTLGLIIVETYWQWLMLMLSHFTHKPTKTKNIATPCFLKNNENYLQMDGEMSTIKNGTIDFAGYLTILLDDE
jgi:diacylglycerol kinase family enzyme